jgi:DNA-binding NarL/FixJ family response regulator
MNVALIDSHPVFRTGLRLLLNSCFDDLNTLESGCMQSFKKAIAPGTADIIIIGLSEEEPQIDQVALKKMIGTNPSASFILYYAHNPGYKLASSLMRIGVKGFLSKDGCPNDLEVCVNSILSGQPYICRQVQH